jgi:hypothetical protein
MPGSMPIIEARGLAGTGSPRHDGMRSGRRWIIKPLMKQMSTNRSRSRTSGIQAVTMFQFALLAGYHDQIADPYI